jgi:hypothetical protein
MSGLILYGREEKRKISAYAGSLRIDQTTKALEEADQSNDPARMRAANEQARNALAEMKNRLSRRMNMMDMMEKMHGRGQKKQ